MFVRDFFDQAANTREFWIARNHYYYDFIERYVRFFVSPEASVLEIGCGSGNLIGKLRNRQKVGIDLSSEMIRRARLRDRTTDYAQWNIEKKNFHGKYDWILAVNLVGYLGDIHRAFENIKRSCHDGTRVMIVIYNHLWEPLLRLGETLGLRSPQPEQNWLGVNDLRNLLDISGYEVIRTDYKILLPYQLPLGSELINRFLATLPVFKHLSLVQAIIVRKRILRRKEYGVSIIVPARNEKGNIWGIVKGVPRLGKRCELIFVEGHSTDGTWAEIKKYVGRRKDGMVIRAFRQEGDGKGDAVRLGFAKAKNELLMILDADMTVHPNELDKFYDIVSSGSGEFVNGSRLVYPMERQSMRFLNKVGNKLFSLLFTLLLGQEFKDTLCGTKVLLKSNYEKIARNRSYFGNFDPFGDFDLLFGAVKQNLHIREVPIRYRERQYGTTNIDRFRHGWLLLRMTWFAFLKFAL